MPSSRQQAIVSALAFTAYPVGMCARFTRERFGVPALGDHDHDGDADAVDMWKASVLKHPGDRNPPAGVPVFWSGGSAGHGHVGVTIGNRLVRSTDWPRAGIVGSVPLDEIERAWAMKYLGWSEDLYGHEIPDEMAAIAELQKRIAKKAARRRELKAQLLRLRDRLRSLRP